MSFLHQPGEKFPFNVMVGVSIYSLLLTVIVFQPVLWHLFRRIALITSLGVLFFDTWETRTFADDFVLIQVFKASKNSPRHEPRGQSNS